MPVPNPRWVDGILRSDPRFAANMIPGDGSAPNSFPKRLTCENMASRFSRSCWPPTALLNLISALAVAPVPVVTVLWLAAAPFAAPQMLLKPAQPGEPVSILPSDAAVLEANESRKDLPCTVTERKPELGFDLRFHSGYDVNLPMKELAGGGDLLSVVFRVYPEGDQTHPTYFAQHFRVPTLDDEVKGDAVLQGSLDLGEGRYHVDWMIRDRSERICSSSWDVEALLPAKDKPILLFINPKEVAETAPHSFLNDGQNRDGANNPDALNVKLLVNFAPQNSTSAALQRSDTDALVTILKAIQRDPHVGRISLVAFNMAEGRVVYRQESAASIDFPALGKALESMKLGTVNLARLSQRHSETDFLQDLITKEVGTGTHPDLVVFAGPKAMLDADVPQEDLRRIGDIDCPVFYMNYNLNPQAVPWKDSISHAIKAFKGTEYTISRPRDVWFSTTEMLNRALHYKRQHSLATAAAGGTR